MKIIPEGFELEQMRGEGDNLILNLIRTQIKAECPKCGVESFHIHSRYIRIIKDLPCFGLSVYLHIRTRRFFCLNLGCKQQIFCERLSELVVSRGRFSLRLNQIISFIGLANGGLMGSRLASKLSISVSHDTLLRRIRSHKCPSDIKVKHLGIDHWAIRKGQRYGTIMVDLERHCVIDLLSGRDSQTVIEWLKQHPEIEIISRDRGNNYIEASSKGAPQAIQVADRFHLLMNLTDTVDRFLKCRNRIMKEAMDAINAQSSKSQVVELESGSEVINVPALLSTQPTKIDLRYERYEQVRAMHKQGAGIQTIAKYFCMHRRTVRLFINAQTFPQRAKPLKRPSKLDKHAQYLKKRWGEGCHSPYKLWKELKAQGYIIGRSTLSRYMMKYRKDLPFYKLKPQSPIPSTRHTAWLFGQSPKDLKPDQEIFITKLCEISPEVNLVYKLAQSFSEMVRARNSSLLHQWLDDAKKSEIQELSNFANGLRKEISSIESALSLPISNGPVEGQVNRLKLLKRQMYGRANLDLLRQRVINKIIA
jgi:transposase